MARFSDVVCTVHRGVSMSERAELGYHGPFKIVFRAAPWFAQFEQVEYGDVCRGLKNPCFADEREWYSESRVEFHSRDVVRVLFMTNAPRSMGPRVLARARNQLGAMPFEYSELEVYDPVLMNRARKTVLA